ncbi:hypothetical protein [Arthrobacter bambusae]|uniref:Uncharacterized protein n=1 Tax=Arthrobacter bambusae TaxID=1338426 RepID=A0AAW8DBA3_9MICC|nr:hypothetical protein [Arthrobacter bambusae]MDP9903162.1 hypothetical protein [Arthrobacter bambusae]MDQ0128844.1 hypothetical protein [Arthrobacter bambusae]MDQ0180185.1 hypothetical protein [Arthrobacter bambusae]
MANQPFVLCECCALKLNNDDESGCRDYHGHGHDSLDVLAGTVISQGPHVWDGKLDLTCHGHKDGVVHPGGAFWVAEIMS